MNLNENAARLCNDLVRTADLHQVMVSNAACGTRLIDCGAECRGGLAAGRALAEICMSGLGEVRYVPSARELWSGPSVAVMTDHPRLACMASQYAGWKIDIDGYFAMASGPMRALARTEKLFDGFAPQEFAGNAVGVLETSKRPTEAVCTYLAAACGVSPHELTLLFAPTASIAGTVQVVARSVETALHKLGELGFDLAAIHSAWGAAPLPPVAKNDLQGIGRTNDAVLYGGEVTLWVRTEERLIHELGPQVPSAASPDYGDPFESIFARYEYDFYRIDPHLFSPAVITFCNLATGGTHRYGELRPDVLQRSFAPA